MTLQKYLWPIVAGLLQLTPAYGQATPWKIEMRQVRLPTANADCGPIEINVRDAEGKPPVTPDGKQIDWQDFDITLTQGEGSFKLTGNGRFLCATAPGARGVITVKYPESTYLTGSTGKGRTGKTLIPGVTVTATLEVSSAGTAQAMETYPKTPLATQAAVAAGQATPASAGSAVTGISITQSLPGPLITWMPLSGASYTVSRWKIDDPACCNSMSPPGSALTVPRWQDTALPLPGTYVYRVTAMTPSGMAYTDAQYNYGATAAISPAPPPATPVPSPAPLPTSASAVPSQVAGIYVTGSRLGPLVAWTPVAGASYTVTRWKSDDPACCSNMSPPSPALTVPQWQDTVPPISGTYIYRVMAMTPAGVTIGEAQYNHIAAPMAATVPSPAPSPTIATGTAMPTATASTFSTDTAPSLATTTSSRIAGTTSSITPTPVPIEGVSVGTTSGQMSSIIQKTLQSTTCSVPVESITAVSGLALTSTASGVILNWTAIPCPSMTYKKVTVGVKDGQTIQSASDAQPSVEAATSRLYITDSPAASGLASANYRIDANLPDGRTVSSQWVTWNSPASQTAATSQSGRYRIVVKGIRVSNNTVDNIMQTDGKFDEVYVAAHTSLYDVRNGSLLKHAMMQSRVHGDIGNGAVFPTRIKAGSASPEGGLRGSVRATPPAWDLVPNTLNPAGPPAQGTTDRLPFILWTGELRDGVDALVVAPSIWESDLDDRTFREYASGAQRMSTEFFTALKVPELAAQVLPAVSQAEITMGVSATPDPGTILGSLLTGSFFLGSTALSSNVDRPIGLSGVVAGVGQQLLFKDSFVVITRAIAEKALSTPPPSPGALPPSVIAITYTDTPTFPGLEGQYVLYLEIQRETVAIVPTSTATPVVPVVSTSTQTSTPTGSTAAQSGQYRVVIKGVRVQHHTVDHILQIDGKYDEIYVAAQVSKFNLKTAGLLQHGTGRSRVHGDIGDGTPFPTRVRAGTASVQGGLRGDDTAMPPVADMVPANLAPGGPPAQGLIDQLPFIAWEGSLTSGEDVLVIAPSIWEWDGDETPFKQYTDIAKLEAQAMFALLNVPLVALSPSIEITQTLLPNTTSATLNLPVQTAAEGLMTFLTSGIYMIAEPLLGTGPDRLIGVDQAVSAGNTASGVLYRDRFIILTRDKIEQALAARPAVPSALPPSVIPIEFFDTTFGFDLRGKYVMYLEVQRQ